MDKYIKRSLLVNASCLGYHWIYDQDFLENLAKTKDLLFQKAEKSIYDQASISYFGYKNHRVGEVTSQGMYLFWLYKALLHNNKLTKTDYQNLIFDKIKPGGDYKGYVESYGKKLIINQFIDELKLKIEKIEIEDDHLVGFMPYIACKELDLDHHKAFELTQLFSKNTDYEMFFNVFDYLLNHLSLTNKNQVLLDSIQFAPSSFKEKLEKAISIADTKYFIKNYSGTACSIHLSIPLIFHMIAHTNDFLELVRMNLRIGGSSSDRGLILGLLTKPLYELPLEFNRDLLLE
jgi:hypothetical protein